MNDRGTLGEQQAVEYLLQQGLTLITRNYRCRYGEIDLIMRERDTLVFVEVKARARPDFGGAAASITRSKQQKLLVTAQHYLSTLTRQPPCRFDALLIEGGNRVSWLRNILDT